MAVPHAHNPRQPYPDPGAFTGYSCGASLLVVSSALLVLPLTYLVVGLIAPPDASQARSGVRDFFAMIGVPWLGFLADTTMAQLGAMLVVFILLFAFGIVWGGIAGMRAARRLPCPRCGATPLHATSGRPLLLHCARCAVTWEVDLGSGDGTQHDTSHHHHF